MNQNNRNWKLTIIGQKISHYKIVEKLGGGGMGVVYKAEDTKLKRTVALKFLPVAFSFDEDAKKRFINEAQAASSLDHNNICNIHEIGETDDGQVFICMNCYEGETLKKKIERGQIKTDEAIDIILQIAAGLQKAHEKGIIHRDIKPANIFITNDGVVKILDFGLAKLSGQTKMTKMGETVGTIAYMSPEQAKGEEVDQRSDIWSLGVVLYEMLTGELPFNSIYEQALIYSILNEEPKRLNNLREDIPSEFENVVFKCLSKNPLDRYKTINELRDDIKGYFDSLQKDEQKGFSVRKVIHLLRKPKVVLSSTAVLVALVLIGIWFINKQAKIRWAYDKAIPEIRSLINYGQYFDAYYLAEEAEEYIPNDTILTELFSKCSFNIDIETEPAGAHIFAKEYKNPTDDWKHIGVTPILSIRLPNAILRMKTEKEGYETLIFATTTWDLDIEEQIDIPINIQRILDKKGSIPQGMVRVSGLETSKGKIADFYIDKFEVTNNQFKKFIDDGGYRNKKFWKYEFIKDGRILAWEKAMSDFVDQTGRTGPSTWSAGYYPEGKGDHPVSGISWYEAAAYAEYVGKYLPTAYHWGVATGEGTPLKYVRFSNFVPFYNFNNKGTVPVGSLDGISSFGAYDMGGNVREWCWNETDLGRLLRGGAWNDPPYMFGNYSQALAFDRSEKNGFRLVVYPEKDKLPDQLFAKASFPELKDFSKIDPVPYAIFQIYKEQFSYDKTALNPSVEWRDESSEEWIQEKVSYNSPYESEKMIAYLFLPKNANPPYQVVVYFPTSYAVYNKSSEVLTSEPDFSLFVDFIVKNGRAVLFPIYKGTFERIDPALRSIHIGQDSYAFSQYLIELVKEFRRSIDYIETREDLDKNKIAYYGVSWGGWLGAIIPAIEDRLKVNIMLAGGFIGFGKAEVNEINYVTRVKIPTLMLNGKYDFDAPIETNIRPMFEYLGTSRKKLEIYESDHMPPRNEYVKEILNWLDLYLGPVR